MKTPERNEKIKSKASLDKGSDMSAPIANITRDMGKGMSTAHANITRRLCGSESGSSPL